MRRGESRDVERKVRDDAGEKLHNEVEGSEFRDAKRKVHNVVGESSQ